MQINVILCLFFGTSAEMIILIILYIFYQPYKCSQHYENCDDFNVHLFGIKFLKDCLPLI